MRNSILAALVLLGTVAAALPAAAQQLQRDDRNSMPAPRAPVQQFRAPAPQVHAPTPQFRASAPQQSFADPGRERFERREFANRNAFLFPFVAPFAFAPMPEPVPSYFYPGMYWYCPNPPGYYPNVQQCFMAWQAVQAPPP